MRPFTGHGGRDSAGPTLVARGGSGLFHGRRMRVSRGGSVSVAGAWVTRGGRRLRSGRVVYAPAGCGVRITFAARRGERFELSAFFRGRAALPRVRRGGRLVTGAGQRVSLSVPARVSVQRGYASATESSLVRTRLDLRAPRAGRVSLTLC